MMIFVLVADESEYAFISAPTTVKDWITVLSMWLETANVDIDDFYQYIDEDDARCIPKR